MELPRLEDLEIQFIQCFFDQALGVNYYEEILQNTNWNQQYIKLFGKTIALPRLTAWHADIDITYAYSGMTLPPRPLNGTLAKIRNRLEDQFEVSFNSVLLNRYRDGNDSVSWHADDEKELGEEPDIASVSLGATRQFQMKHRRFEKEKLTLDLNHGSVLLMRGETQKNWLHRVPKTRKPVGERINLTFRFIHE